MQKYKPSPLSRTLTPLQIRHGTETCQLLSDQVNFVRRVASLCGKDYEAYATRNLSFLAKEDDAHRFASLAGGCYAMPMRIETSLRQVCTLANISPPVLAGDDVHVKWKAHCVQGCHTPQLAAAMQPLVKAWTETVETVQRLMREADDSGEYSDLSAYSSSEESGDVDSTSSEADDDD